MTLWKAIFIVFYFNFDVVASAHCLTKPASCYRSELTA